MPHTKELPINVHPLLHCVCEKIANVWNPCDWTQFKVIVAVSGGADSVLMLRALHQLAASAQAEANLLVAHVNHQTREGSLTDQTFVASLADALNLKFVSASGSAKPKTDENSLRDIRHRLLIEMAQQHGARYVTLGHHRDDQVETILFRIIRGTGLAGLAGIPLFRPMTESITLVRPMLDMGRNEILEALGELNQNYCTDPTNADSAYSRNFLRNELIPLIEKRFGDQFKTSLNKLGMSAAEVERFVAQQSQPLDQSVIQATPTRIEIATPSLIEHEPILIRNMLVRVWANQNWPLGQMTFEKWNQLAELAVSSESKSMNLPGNIRAERSGSSLILQALNAG